MAAASTENPMREIVIEKVTMNIGIGEPGERLEHAKSLIERLSGSKAIETKAHDRNPTFKLRKGMPIGAKTTLRGKKATAFLDKALASRKRVLREGNFDNRGNFSFGVKEYIDFPGAKYDPSIGMMGFDVCVTLGRRGSRVAKRKVAFAPVGKNHVVTKEEGMQYAKSKLNVSME